MPLKKVDENVEKVEKSEGLERRKRKRDLDGLKIQLESHIPSERRWAARDLAQFPDASTILIEALQKENDISVREVILNSLLKIGDEKAILGLLEVLKSDDAHLRNEAVQILKEMPDKVEPYIESLLNDPDPDLRIFAINMMDSVKPTKIIEWLRYILENDEDVNVCGAALNVLSEVGTEDVEKSVNNVKERFPEEPFIQFTADFVLRRIHESFS